MQARPRAYPRTMALVSFSLPTDEEEDLLRRFTVNSNYLQAISGFIATTYGRREKLYAGLRATVEAMPRTSGSTRAGRPGRGAPLLDAGVDERDPAPPAGDHGQPRDAPLRERVGAGARLLRGLRHAPGLVRRQRHEGRRRRPHRDVERSPRRSSSATSFPSPGISSPLVARCAASASTSTTTATTAQSRRGVVDPSPVRRRPGLLAAPRHLAAQHARGAATGARGAMEDARKKQRIAPASAQISQSVAPTSLFDCFWRMRIKSNYGTIDPYLVDQISETDHQIYNSALCTVTAPPSRCWSSSSSAGSARPSSPRSRPTSSSRTRTTSPRGCSAPASTHLLDHPVTQGPAPWGACTSVRAPITPLFLAPWRARTRPPRRSAWGGTRDHPPVRRRAAVCSSPRRWRGRRAIGGLRNGGW